MPNYHICQHIQEPYLPKHIRYPPIVVVLSETVHSHFEDLRDGAVGGR